MNDTMIGVDLAKTVFQIHGASMTGQVKLRKKLAREQFRRFMSEQPPSVMVFEACGSANYWGGRWRSLGMRLSSLLRNMCALSLSGRKTTLPMRRRS